MKNTRVPRVCPSQDVRPVTEFRAHASAFLDQVRATRRAMILTQHGRSAAVLLDVSVYEELLGELTVLRETRSAGHLPSAAADDETLKHPVDPRSLPLT